MVFQDSLFGVADQFRTSPSRRSGSTRWLTPDPRIHNDSRPRRIHPHPGKSLAHRKFRGVNNLRGPDQTSSLLGKPQISFQNSVPMMRLVDQPPHDLVLAQTNDPCNVSSCRSENAALPQIGVPC